MSARIAIRTALALLCLVAPLPRVGAAYAQEGGARVEAEHAAAGRRSVDLEQARRRWECLSPAEQERLRDRYERLLRMGEAERRELEQRRRYLERLERMLVERLDERDRARLAALDPRERERLLREMVADELEQEARRVEEKLPPGWRERLREADPADRRRFLDEFRRQVRIEWTPRALERLGRELGVEPERIEAWKALPHEARGRKLLELGKRRRALAVERHGLPHDLSLEEWNRLESLPPERFFEEAMRLRAARGWEPGEPFFRPPGDAEDPRREELRHVRRAGRPRPEDRLEFLHLSPEDRRDRVEERRRERLLGALADSGLVSPAEIESMRALPPGAFWKRARERNAELGLGLGSGRRADPPPPREGDEPPPRRDAERGEGEGSSPPGRPESPRR